MSSIILNSAEVHALKTDWKVTLWRPMKEQPQSVVDNQIVPFNGDAESLMQLLVKAGAFPNFRVGKLLWVKETFIYDGFGACALSEDCTIFYRADYWADPHGMDGEKSPEGKYRSWLPATRMPEWASRFNVEVVGIRAEQAQGDLLEPEKWLVVVDLEVAHENRSV